MKKNDKIIAVVGVLILVLASMGVFFYEYQETAGEQIEDIEEITCMVGEYKQSLEGMSLTVPNTDPFYAFVATPLAVHYDSEGNKEIIPLYIEDYEAPSEAIERLQNSYLVKYKNIDLADEVSSGSIEEFSLEIAEKYWDSSNAALLLENSKEGYSLGLNALPMASYLGIPVIVTESISGDVQRVLSKLGVGTILVCGDVEGYDNSFRYIKYDNIEEIIDDSINFMMEKFGDIEYLALANPADAMLPEVLDSKEEYFGSSTTDWSFKIPNDYKYALIRIEAISEEPVSFRIGADLDDINSVLQEQEATDGGNPIPVRDDKGNILSYVFFRESVVYGRNGVTYNVYGPTDGSVRVTIEKLENPVYPMMKGLSKLAPYLAVSHQGIVFANESFAFTANDDLRDENGEKIPGFYMPRFNPKLTTLCNKHIYDNVHKPLNNVLAKIADINLNEKTYTKDVKYLQNYYNNKDLSIAIVGGATVLPQYTYQNLLEPFGDVDGDGTDDTAYNMGGGGTPSDVIYGNIDPVKYDWSNMAQDIYTDLPQMENAIGRIVGWDAQDADALILRSIFYDDILENLEGWKDNFGILIGGGVDHQKPLIPYKLEQWFGLFSLIKNIASSNPLTEVIARFMDANGPWKYSTKATEISGLRLKEKTAEEMGFDVNFALKSHAMIKGYTDEELKEIKNKNILYKLLFKPDDVKDMIGEHAVKGGEYMEQSNYIFANAHGAIGTYGMDGPDLVSAGFDIKLIPGKWIEKIVRRVTPIFAGWVGPGMGLGTSYTPKTVTGLEMGPSFMWLDSCTCGKIDGVYPKQSVSMALLHSGVGCLVASTTGSNIPGGYLPGKDKMTDTRLSVFLAEKEWEKKVEQGIYPDLHFGFKMFEDMSGFLKEEDCSTGEAFKQMKNIYLPEDLDWELWWTPPLSGGDAPDVYGPHHEAKYTSYYEFTMYGDPAFNPYEPVNEGYN